MLFLDKKSIYIKPNNYSNTGLYWVFSSTEKFWKLYLRLKRVVLISNYKLDTCFWVFLNSILHEVKKFQKIDETV